MDADLLLHVVDAANPGFPEQIAEVQRVLADIDADDVPQIIVFNKCDALDKDRTPLHLLDSMEVGGVQVPRLFVSAKSGLGLPELRRLLAQTYLGGNLDTGPSSTSAPAINDNADSPSDSSAGLASGQGA